MERKPSLEKEKKNISNFLPKALIEEINKTYDDKNHNKSSFSLKEKELNSNINNNSMNSINGIHNGFSLNNKNTNLLNGSYQNMNEIIQTQANVKVKKENIDNNNLNYKKNNFIDNNIDNTAIKETNNLDNNNNAQINNDNQKINRTNKDNCCCLIF